MKRFIIYLLGLIIIAGIAFSFKSSLFLNSAKTEGTVVDTKAKTELESISYQRFFSDMIDYFPVIVYEVQGNNHQLIGPENQYKKGDHVEILYNTKDPSEARVNTFTGLFVDSSLIIIGLVFLLWSAFAFSFIK